MAFPLRIIDQIGTTITVNAAPKRIISLVPSLTELLCDLGLEPLLIGVTKFCIHPAYLKKTKTIVGGTKTINFKTLENLKPDLIICNKEENTRELVNKCKTICPVHVSNINTLHDVYELIESYGILFNVTEIANVIISKLKKESSNFETFIKNKPKLKVAYFIWKSPWLVAANNTFINYLLEKNNYINVFKTLNRYPEIDIKTTTVNPNVIFLSSEPFPFKNRHILEIKPHFKQAKIILVNGEYFSWYGTRLLNAFSYFKNLHKTKVNQ